MANGLITSQFSGKRAAGQLSEAACRSSSGDAAVYENCHANSNLSEYYDSVRATARSRGSVSASGITGVSNDRLLTAYAKYILVITSKEAFLINFSGYWNFKVRSVTVYKVTY